MKSRPLATAIRDLAFADRKMALVSGPRQCGKTTLAKLLLEGRTGSYRTWDDPIFRREWLLNPSGVVPKPAPGGVPLLVLDEIHKEHRWKRNLKGLYDLLASPCDILVTGSARLNVFRKGSDSLLGRHYSFRLHPFTMGELAGTGIPSPDAVLQALREGGTPKARWSGEVDGLMKYGPFPEPLLRQDERRSRIWRRNREELVIRQDLRDLSRLPELSRVESMTALLPTRIGSLFSLASMGRDLEASIPTIRRWMNYLSDLYYLFEVKPWSRKIPRALRREGKVYLWDYGAVPDEAVRFENLVAHHLLKACQTWTDTGEGDFDLHYLRNKEGEEIDFLVVRDGQPWLPVEVKLSDAAPSPNWRRFAPHLPCRFGLQITRAPAWTLHEFPTGHLRVAGAAESLACFP